MYAIRLYSKDNDDLRRGTDNDDEMKMYEKYRCKVNMWENSFDGNCIRLGCRIEAEFVPRPSLYSPTNKMNTIIIFNMNCVRIYVIKNDFWWAKTMLS